MQEKVADLHIHTYLSDGTFSPKQVLEISHKLGIACIAITDHDSIDGIEPVLKLAKSYEIEVIPGVELTAEVGDNEVHIIGYYIDWRDKGFGAKLKALRHARVERIKKMVEKLAEFGINIEAKEVFEFAGPGAVGRLHLAQVMYQKGLVASIDEAFRKYIRNHGPCYVKKFTLSPREAIEMIKSVGGIPVLAHPHLLKMDELIPSFIRDGLQGIEVYHSDHLDQATQRYEKLAHKYGLLITGGSDCHGLGKKEVLIGKVKLPYSLVEKLKEGLRPKEGVRPVKRGSDLDI